MSQGDREASCEVEMKRREIQLEQLQTKLQQTVDDYQQARTRVNQLEVGFTFRFQLKIKFVRLYTADRKFDYFAWFLDQLEKKLEISFAWFLDQRN